MKIKPHLRLEADPRYQLAIVCGAPERAEFIGTFLEGVQPIAKNREYHSYLGKFRGRDVLVLSHGVGSAGAAICFQELIDVGAKSIIRIGTAGGLTDDSDIGDVAIATAAVRRDGVTPLMVPISFPAVADVDLTSALFRSLSSRTDIRTRRGIVVTSDLFYDGLLESELPLFQKAGAIAVEMECSALFVISQLRGVRAAASLVLDGNPLRWSEGHYDPRPERLKTSIEACIHASLEALLA